MSMMRAAQVRLLPHQAGLSFGLNSTPARPAPLASLALPVVSLSVVCLFCLCFVCFVAEVVLMLYLF